MANQIHAGYASRSAHTEQRLFKYVLTAGAGMLAAATPADAGIVYIDAPDQTYANVNFALDLNGDLSDDVQFTNPLGSVSRHLYAFAPNGVMLAGNKAAALSPSVNVGPTGSFASNAKMAYAYNFPASGWVGGPWANVTDRYLGLRFDISGNTHYGWVRMDVSADWPSLTIAATVKDWAYESDPDTAIHAGVPGGEVPEPGTLSLLALGAAGLAAWRRRKPARV